MSVRGHVAIRIDLDKGADALAKMTVINWVAVAIFKVVCLRSQSSTPIVQKVKPL